MKPRHLGDPSLALAFSFSFPFPFPFHFHFFRLLPVEHFVLAPTLWITVCWTLTSSHFNCKVLSSHVLAFHWLTGADDLNHHKGDPILDPNLRLRHVAALSDALQT